jgi:trigger factor
MDVDEEKELTVQFPDDFRVDAVAGRQGVYTTRVKGIREAVLPEIDEEFLKRFDVESPEELRRKVREDMEEAAEQADQRNLRQELGKFLISKTRLDVPASIVEQETRLMVRDIVQRSAMQGTSREQIEEQHEQIMSAAAASSADRVKLSYILSRIADEEGVTVTEEEVDGRIGEMSARYGMSVEQFKAELDKRNTLEQLETDMRNEKTMDFLLEHAKIKKR